MQRMHSADARLGREEVAPLCAGEYREDVQQDNNRACTRRLLCCGWGARCGGRRSRDRNTAINDTGAVKEGISGSCSGGSMWRRAVGSPLLLPSQYNPVSTRSVWWRTAVGDFILQHQKPMTFLAGGGGVKVTASASTERQPVAGCDGLNKTVEHYTKPQRDSMVRVFVLTPRPGSSEPNLE